MENLKKWKGGEVPHDLTLVKDQDDWETKSSWGNTVYVQG